MKFGSVKPSFRVFLSALVLLFAVPLLSGCMTANGPTYLETKAQIPNLMPDQTRIYFLRKSIFYASVATARIYLDDVLVTQVDNGGYAYLDVEPGIVHLKMDTSQDSRKSELVFEVKPNNEVYLDIVLDPERAKAEAFFGVFGTLAVQNGTFALVYVSEEEAQLRLPMLRSLN